MKKLAVCVAAMSIAGPAFSAGLQSRVVPSPIAADPIYSWNGFYIGGNVGYGFGGGGTGYVQAGQYFNLNSLDDQGIGLSGPLFRPSQNLQGAIGGGQIGFNYQAAPYLVLGLEADIQGSGLKTSSAGSVFGTQQFFPQPFGGANFPLLSSYQTTQSVDWFGTIRARVGVTPFIPNVLIYGTGGLAYGQVRQNFGYNSFYTPSAPLGFVGGFAGAGTSTSSTRLGYTVGGGVEWAPTFMPNWSVKAEYLYTDLNTSTTGAIGTGYRLDGQNGRTISAASVASTRWNTVRVGVNYRFNFGQSAGFLVY